MDCKGLGRVHVRRGQNIRLFTESECRDLGASTGSIFSPRYDEVAGYGECDIATDRGLQSFSLACANVIDTPIHPQVTPEVEQPSTTTTSTEVSVVSDVPKRSWMLPLIAVGIAMWFYMKSRR